MFRGGGQMRGATTVVAAVFLCALPSASGAAWLGLRNDTGVTIYVQAYTLGNPIAKGGRKLFPREQTSMPVVQPGVKIIAIYNVQGQLAGRIPVTFAQKDLFFSIQVQGGKVILQPTEAPKNGGGR